jgi:hypothetical protein
MRAYKIEGNKVVDVEWEGNTTYGNEYFIDKKNALEWAIYECESRGMLDGQEIEKLTKRQKIVTDRINQTMDDIGRLQKELEELV